MRWIRFTNAERGTSYGIVEADRVLAVDGSPFGDFRLTGDSFALDGVKIEVPVVPGTFYCAGRNYAGHIKAVSNAGIYSAELPKTPHVAYRANNGLLPHGGDVVIPSDSRIIQYEPELVVVIGKTARRVELQDALNCVLGYTICNDVSERSWQRTDSTLWRAKNCDTFTPLGPWIDTEPDLEAMETIVRVSGVEHTRFPTHAMIFGVAEFISAITRYVTLNPGDVISMGADGGSPDLHAGDEVEIELTGLGILRNRFVAEVEP